MSIFHRKIIYSTYCIADTVTVFRASINGDYFQGLETSLVNTCKKISFLELSCYYLTSIVEIHFMVVCREDPCQCTLGVFYYYIKHVLRFALSDEPVSYFIVDPALLGLIPGKHFHRKLLLANFSNGHLALFCDNAL